MKFKPKIDKYQEGLRQEIVNLRKEHKTPNAVVPSSRTLKTHDILTTRLIRDLDHDPVKELVNIAKHPGSSLQLKATVNMELLQYMVPKLKAIDTNPNAGETIQINVVMPGSNEPQAIQVIQPGSLPLASTIDSNYIDDGEDLD